MQNSKTYKCPDEMSILERLQSPSPKLFRKLRLLGILLGAPAAVVAALASGGLALPVAITAIAKAIAVVGGTTAAISSLPVDTNGAENGGVLNEPKADNQSAGQ